MSVFPPSPNPDLYELLPSEDVQYLIDYRTYFLAFVRVKECQHWTDDSLRVDPPASLDEVEVPDDAVGIMVMDRFNGSVDFWELNVTD